MATEKPGWLRIINSVAPIRICDNGGWTDTWFAKYGRIFNIGVYPYVEVQIRVYPRYEMEHRVILNAENFGHRYAIFPKNERHEWIHHPLLEAAIDYMGVPADLSAQISIFSEAPAGCSTGTSAAVTVALIGALNRLTPTRMTPLEIAYAAHRIETEILHQQSGIQDQLCSAFGGVNYIQMFDYPYAAVSPIFLPNETWWELERRLCLIFLGRSHSSSAIHEMVIHGLEDDGPDNPKLEALREKADLARNAVYDGDFVALGKAMSANTEAQRNLHPGLVSQDAQQIIEIAQKHGALGWKVNGAGGEGGSLTILSGSSMSQKRNMIQAIEQTNPMFQNIPVYLSRFGVRVWTQEPEGGD
ncbi:MAG: GHMP kinase [Chloroflexi bacterium]|jgi:D-glycero-alpha-D-manno-heptose-7-phosphate kinase|nr:GHMP kinase [Chloroflexota bacterium]